LATADLDWFGALGAWDRAALKTGSSFNSKLNFASLAYDSAIGSEGMRWTLNSTYVRSRPGPAANLAASDLQTKSIAGGLQLDYPLLRSREQNLYLRSSLTSFDGRSEFILADVSDDHIRAARVGLNYDRADSWRGVNTLDVEYSHGLNALGAREQGSPTSPLSRVNGRTDFSKITWYAARLQSLGGPWSSLFAVTGQQAFATLLAPELFSFGGELFGRGYDAAEIAGDSGEAAKAELRFSGTKPQFVVPAYTFYEFFDWGEIRVRQPINEPAREVASSCGLGLRLSGDRNLWQAFLEVAKPINRDVAAEGNRRPRVYFGVQVNR
jgi:hemolysin activation/secretion protein